MPERLQGPVPAFPQARPSRSPAPADKPSGQPSRTPPKFVPPPPRTATAAPYQAPPQSPAPAEGLERQARLALRRGRRGIEARLDLHGMVQSEAHAALTGFLLRARAAGHTYVLIVTGKGGASYSDPFGERGPVGCGSEGAAPMSGCGGGAGSGLPRAGSTSSSTRILPIATVRAAILAGRKLVSRDCTQDIVSDVRKGVRIR